MENIDKIMEYRIQHPRCRTCEFANQKCDSWVCKAKGIEHIILTPVQGVPLMGCFCKLYEPRNFNKE